MPIPAEDRHRVLARKGRDPDVVARNRLAAFSKIGADFGVVFGRMPSTSRTRQLSIKAASHPSYFARLRRLCRRDEAAVPDPDRRLPLQKGRRCQGSLEVLGFDLAELPVNDFVDARRFLAQGAKLTKALQPRPHVSRLALQLIRNRLGDQFTQWNPLPGCGRLGLAQEPVGNFERRLHSEPIVPYLWETAAYQGLENLGSRITSPSVRLRKNASKSSRCRAVK